MDDNYTSADIEVLEGLEPVRKRPGMYIGSTSERGLHQLVYEIVDNAVDEALAGFCDEITVEVFPDNSIGVFDNGRGVDDIFFKHINEFIIQGIIAAFSAADAFDYYIGADKGIC